MYLIGEENVAVIFSKLIGFFLVKQWHSSNVSLFHCSDWSQVVSQSQSQRKRCDQGECDGCWEGVFLLSITHSALFRHASSVPSSSYNPNREDWGRVCSRFCNFHRNLKRKVLL